MAVGLVCLPHPDLCEYTVDKFCKDTTEAYNGVFSKRKDYKPRKPGRKKQGREPGEKKRQNPNWKPSKPPKEPPRYTPSRKD